MNIRLQLSTIEVASIDNGITTSYNKFYYVNVYDVDTNELTPANGITAEFQYFINGSAAGTFTRTITGSQQKISELTYLEVNNTDGSIVNSADIAILTPSWQAPAEAPSSPEICDAVITSVRIDKKESAPGVADAQITIVAQSSQLPITYSLDGITFQSSPIFTGLHGGIYTAYITDPGNCTATTTFTIDTIKSLLIADPSVDIGGGNISRWNAAFNPIVFTYQRKDFEVTGITADGNGNILVSINGDVTALTKGDQVYLCAGPYQGVYSIENPLSGYLPITLPYIPGGPYTGYININKLRPYYQVKTNISYWDKVSGAMKNITSTNRPDTTGLVRADISSFLQSLVQVKDESDYTQINFRDDNLSASYTISYAEVWDGQTTPPVFVTDANPYYVIYAAKQLGDAYGGNLAAYVPFPSVNSQGKLAKWVTDFAEPAYSIGFPFDIGFIYGEALAGRDIYCETTLLDINRQPITGSSQTATLLNEDGSFLLNQDGGKLVIAGASASTQPIVQHVGLNRLLVNHNFPPEAYYFTLALKYDVAEVAHTITQTQTVRIDQMPDDQSVYLRWIGLTGSWNYYRFIYNQEVSLDVQNAVIIKNYVSDWANQNSIEEVISKSAGQKMKVIAEDLSVADIKGLQSIKYSPKVQMLISKNPVKWQTVVLNTATFAEYETRNGQAPFSVTFNLPSINVQAQ